MINTIKIQCTKMSQKIVEPLCSTKKGGLEIGKIKQN